MKKTIAFIFYVLLLFAATFFLPSYYKSYGKTAGIQVTAFTSAAGNKYHFYKAKSARLRFTLQRPSKSDSTVLLSIAGAFTASGKPDGIYCADGKLFNRDSINTTLGGAIILHEQSVRIIPTAKGKLFTPRFIDSLQQIKASFFQQIQMVVNGKAEDSKSEKKFQCRGIVVMKNGGTAIVESVGEITLKVFAKDMEESGQVKDLLYTDMGAWDEGWYRNEKGKITVTGINRSQTEKQSNWVIYQK